MWWRVKGGGWREGGVVEGEGRRVEGGGCGGGSIHVKVNRDL